MAMIDLKRPKPKEDKKANKAAMVEGPYWEERPYCLRITLEKPELEKLGLTPQSFKDMEPIKATVLLDPITIRDIESKSSYKYDENRNESVELQVLEIEFGAMTKKKSSKFNSFSNQNKKGPGE